MSEQIYPEPTVGVLIFNQEGKIFLMTSPKWKGEPRESDEMRPQWFSVNSLPWGYMWDDYSYWLPKILKGERLEAAISFGPDDQKVSSSKIHIIT